MIALVFLLGIGFAAALFHYYALVWKIRGERVGGLPSTYQLLSNPFFVQQADLTERGQRLHRRLLVTFGILVVLGLGAVGADMQLRANFLTSNPS